MDCELETCHMRGICRLKNIAENCSLHRQHLKTKALEMSGIDSSELIKMREEESVKNYVKRIAKAHPELAKVAEEHARELLEKVREEL